MVVRDFMLEDLPVCSPTTPISSAARTMVDANSPILLVISSRSTLPIGVLSCHEITTRLIALYQNPLECRAIDAMSMRGTKLSHDTTVHTAWHQMRAHQQKWSIVTNAEGTLAGCVSADTLRTALHTMSYADEAKMASSSLFHHYASA